MVGNEKVRSSKYKNEQQQVWTGAGGEEILPEGRMTLILGRAAVQENLTSPAAGGAGTVMFHSGQAEPSMRPIT